MFSCRSLKNRAGRRAIALSACAAATLLLFVLSLAHVDARGRRSSGGSVRQTRNSSNFSNNRNANRNSNVNRNTNVNRNVNVNNNVNVNRNVHANRGYGYGRGGAVAVGEEGAVAVGRRGAVAVGEEGMAAVGRRGAVVAGEEGFVGVGRYGGVVAGEHYESHAGWAAAAGVATGIAIGTMLARPPATYTTVVVSGTNYMYADGVYYEQVYYGGDVSYRVISAPPGAVITTLPTGCTTTIVGGASYTQCGATYYQRVTTGYRVVVF